MPTVTVDYFGFTGTGPTVKEAKQDAGRKIQALQSGYWSPKIVEWRGYAILITRNLHGWERHFIQHPGEALHVGSSCCGYESEQEAVASARRHVADCGWTPADPIDLFPEFLTDEHDRREIITGRKWQINMQTLMRFGTDQETARKIIAGWEPMPDNVAALPYPETR